MTPAEVSKTATDMLYDNHKLSHTEMGMGNYKEVLAAYLRIQHDLIVCVRELANSLMGEKKDG